MDLTRVNKFITECQGLAGVPDDDPGANLAAEAFRRGASAYVLKQSAGDELLLAVRNVNQGASYLSPRIFDNCTQLGLLKRSGRPACSYLSKVTVTSKKNAR